MNESMIAMVAEWLAAAYARGKYEEHDLSAEQLEGYVADYVECFAAQWVSTARGCLGMADGMDSRQMKRFILFGGYDYYATGGFNDFLSSHDTADEAVKRAEELMAKRLSDRIEWWHVYDAQLGEIVGHSETQAHGTDEAYKNGGKPTLKERQPGGS